MSDETDNEALVDRLIGTVVLAWSQSPAPNLAKPIQDARAEVLARMAACGFTREDVRIASKLLRDANIDTQHPGGLAFKHAAEALIAKLAALLPPEDT